MKLSKVEEQGVKIATLDIPKSKEQSFDIEKEIKEIKALLIEILENIAKKS
tara:strand:+ start:328 stop:480 length:153 start_codon:yes stop_codon:yes gene_type:complete